MATKKINVRSPFYVEVNSQAPPSPTPPTPDATFYEWNGVASFQQRDSVLAEDLTTYTSAQLQDEFICSYCNPFSLQSAIRPSKFTYTTYKSKRLPMQVGDQVYDASENPLTSSGTAGTTSYGIEAGKAVYDGVNPCKKSTEIAGTTQGLTTYKSKIYLNYIYTWDASGVITAVDVPTSDCEEVLTIEQDLSCGEIFTIGEDIGNRKFIVDGTNKLGNFRFSVASRVPVQILTTVNGVQTDQKYVGGDNYEQIMLNAGVPSSELVNLDSGDIGTGVFTLNKTSNEHNQVILEVRAPVETSTVTIDLNLCPADNSRNAAPAITDTSGNLILGTEAMIFEFEGVSAGIDVGLEISINGSVVKTLTAGELEWNSNNIKSFVLTNITSSEYEMVIGGNGYIKDKTPTLIDCSTMTKADNRIGFKWTNSSTTNQISVRSGQFKVMRTAIFYESSSSSYRWADSRLHYLYNNYGQSSVSISYIRDLINKQKALLNFVNQKYEINYQIVRSANSELHAVKAYLAPYTAAYPAVNYVSSDAYPLSQNVFFWTSGGYAN
tara:strand:- start:744 stop:2393 length:1650 start_codon:yes stop_codon:yes gene_type:complete